MSLRDEILMKINNLCNSLEIREEVARWAFSKIDNEELTIKDGEIYNILVWIGAVDLIDPTTEDGYLYHIDDFLEWRKILINSESHTANNFNK